MLHLLRYIKKDYKISSIYKIYGLILTQASEASPTEHNLMVSLIHFLYLVDLTRSSKALDWTSDPTKFFWHHQFGAVCG